MVAELSPIRERALALQKDPDYVRDALRQGARKCRAVAAATMEEVRSALGLARLD
jgi:tryptophanyl-tRNA synthetase